MKHKSYKSTNEEIINAFILLFDSDVAVSVDTIRCIRPLEVKIAFRKKAFETHPDRARLVGASEAVMAERFKDVSLAYEKLSSYTNNNYIKDEDLSSKGSGHRWNTTSSTKKNDNKWQAGTSDKGNNKKKKTGSSATRHNNTWKTGSSVNKNNNKCKTDSSSKGNTHKKDNRPSHSSNSSDFYHNWSIPKIELMIGQFLFYSGVISWKSLINSIVWQRKQRPLFGQIAMDWNMLSENDIRIILQERNIKEKIGEYALRNGYINSFEHMAIVGKQRNLQHPIGEYYIRNRVINSQNLEMMVEKQRVHNFKVRVRENRKRP